jgi:hypothetical protein
LRQSSRDLSKPARSILLKEFEQADSKPQFFNCKAGA